MRPRYLALLVVLSAAALAAIVVAAGRAKDEARALRDGPVGAQAGARFAGAPLPPGVRVPDFALRDQDGRLVTARSLRGRPAVVTFLYTICNTACPITAHQVKGALDELERPVPAIAISVDPPNDTRLSAQAFVERVGIGGRLRFLLGSRSELRRVWRGFAVRPQTARVEHQARIVLIDGRGMQRVGFPVSQATPERLAHDLRALGAE